MKKLIFLLLIPLALFAYDVNCVLAKAPVMQTEMGMGFFIGKEQFHFKVLKSESGRHVWITPDSNPNRPVWKFRGYATPLNVRIEVSYMGEGSFKLIEHEPTGQKTYLVRFDGKTAHCELPPEATFPKLSSSNAESEKKEIPSSTSFNAKSEEGELNIDSDPLSAAVFIDGEYRGNTRLRIKIKSGTHSIQVGKDFQVGKDHYEDHKEQIELRSGETREVFAKLTKKNTLPPSSTSFNAKSERNALVVDSSPQGALVQINRQYMGETPLRLSNIYPGGHDLRVFKPGYSDYYEHFQHVKGTQKNVFANLTKEDTPPPSSTSSNAKTEGGILVVGSAPTGADVFIDGEYVGRTSLRLSNIKPGSRYVRVAYKGYVDYYENIDISEGSQRVISAWLALAKENTPPPSSTSSNSEQTRTQGSKPSIFVDILKGFAEGINQSNERMDAEQKGLNYDCVRAVNEMVKGGEISRSKGDFLINRDCKKPKERIEPYEGWLVHPSSPTYRARPDGFGGYRIERE